MFTVAVVFWVSCIGVLVGYLHLTCRLAEHYRRVLRPSVERYVIEKRRIERWSRSGTDYDRRWQSRLRTLYEEHVRPRHRRLFSLRDFGLALNAELACLLNAEIACWTFMDRVCTSPAAFSRVVGRCLERNGWSVEAGARLVVVKKGRRLAVHCHFDAEDAGCLTMQAAASATRRDGCDVGCIVTNGRTDGPTRVFSETFGIPVIHYSELDQLDALIEVVEAGAERPREPNELAA